MKDQGEKAEAGWSRMVRQTLVKSLVLVWY